MSKTQGLFAFGAAAGLLLAASGAAYAAARQNPEDFVGTYAVQSVADGDFGCDEAATGQPSDGPVRFWRYALDDAGQLGGIACEDAACEHVWVRGSPATSFLADAWRYPIQATGSIYDPRTNPNHILMYVREEMRLGPDGLEIKLVRYTSEHAEAVEDYRGYIAAHADEPEFTCERVLERSVLTRVD
jgi:hypothetical protein